MRVMAGGWAAKLKVFLTREGMPDGDFATNFAYPEDLLPARRATGFGLYKLLGIDRKDMAARNLQMRRNFEFFGAPTVMFLFVHKGLREYSVLDAGIWLQTLMLSAQARGLATCAQGALATWAGPVKQAFDVSKDYKLVCGLSIGYASDDPVNAYNPGRGAARRGSSGLPQTGEQATDQGPEEQQERERADGTHSVRPEDPHVARRADHR